MTRFTVKKNDTIKATLSVNNRLICSLYDSQFTTISEIVGCLINKENNLINGKKCEIVIYNTSTEKTKYITKIAK